MTVEELAEAAKMSVGNLSALENKRQGYSTGGLERLAEALRITTAALLTVNPLADEATGEFWGLWERVPPDGRETLAIMARRLIGHASPKK